MGVINKTFLLAKILKLKLGVQTQEVKLRIQKLQQKVDNYVDGKHE